MDAAVVRDLLLSAGWRRVLDRMKVKTDDVSFLSRAQLLLVYGTLFTIYKSLRRRGRMKKQRRFYLS